MRLRLTLLVLSVGLNLAFAALLWRGGSTTAGPKSPSAGSSSDGAVVKEERGAESLDRSQNAAVGAPQIGFHWAQLESENYREYVERLRRFGVPEKIIRDLIMAEVDKTYRPKLAAVRPRKAGDTNFWEQQNRFGPFGGQSAEQRRQMTGLQNEQREMVKTLLGKDVYNEISKESGYPDWTERMFGPISTEQRDKVSEMQQKFQQASSEIYAKNDGMVDMESQNELKVLRRKFRDDLATVLTPQQIEEYELRSSDIVNNMRFQLDAFQPNEQEFRAIFKYKQALEDLTPIRGGDDTVRPSAEEMKSAQQKRKDLEASLSEALSPDRMKAFKLMDQYEYRNLLDSGVTLESVSKIVDIRQQAEDAARKIRSDQNLASDKRTEALQAIRAETEKTLNDLLGERRAKYYTRNGGFWMRSLSPMDGASRLQNVIQKAP